jgi:hypothetical protein
MTINDLSFGQEVYVLILGLPKDTDFSEKCRSGRVTDINNDGVVVTTDIAVYNFLAKNKFYLQDDYYAGISYKLFINKSDIDEYLSASEMYSDLLWAFQKNYGEFESTFSIDDVKSIYSQLFPERLSALQWTAHNVGQPNERYNASVREYAFLITFLIEPVENKWYIRASGAANAQNSVHAREYEMSSAELSLDDAMECANRFCKMMYHMFKEDLVSI